MKILATASLDVTVFDASKKMTGILFYLGDRN